MDRYSAKGQITAVAATYKTAIILRQPASQITRQRIYDLVFSASGTPADNALVWNVNRCTGATLGTGTAVIPEPLEGSAAPAASALSIQDASAEPTAYTAALILLENALNQRATFRWVAAPGSEFVIPNTTLVGIGMRVKSAGYTGVAEVTTLFTE